MPVESQPNFSVGFGLLAILFLLFMGFIVLKAINHRRGVALVVSAVSLFVGVCLLYALTERRYAASQPATATLQPVESSPVPFVGQTAEVGPTIPLDTDRPSSAAPQTPAAPQPAWIGQTQKKVDGGVTFAVKTGPEATEGRCQKELTDVLRTEVNAYIDNYLGQPGAGERVQLKGDYISGLLEDTFLETRLYEPPVGEMLHLHGLVRIDRAAHDLIRQKHETALVQARLGYAAGAFGLVLVLLGTAFGYLKLDTATKGFYSGRLKLAATAVILTAAAATVLVVRQADPAAEWPVGFPVRETSQLSNF